MMNNYCRAELWLAVQSSEGTLAQLSRESEELIWLNKERNPESQVWGAKLMFSGYGQSWFSGLFDSRAVKNILTLFLRCIRINCQYLMSQTSNGFVCSVNVKPEYTSWGFLKVTLFPAYFLKSTLCMNSCQLGSISAFNAHSSSCRTLF